MQIKIVRSKYWVPCAVYGFRSLWQIETGFELMIWARFLIGQRAPTSLVNSDRRQFFSVSKPRWPKTGNQNQSHSWSALTCSSFWISCSRIFLFERIFFVIFFFIRMCDQSKNLFLPFQNYVGRSGSSICSTFQGCPFTATRITEMSVSKIT